MRTAGWKPADAVKHHTFGRTDLSRVPAVIEAHLPELDRAKLLHGTGDLALAPEVMETIAAACRAHYETEPA